MLDAALAAYDRGWSVFPLLDKRTPHVPWKSLQTQRTTREQITAWWQTYSDAYIGVALGRVSNLLRVDVDSPFAIAKLAELGGPGDGAEFRSPSGGTGYLYAYLDGVKTGVVAKGSGEHEELRVQSDGAYTVVPPSPGYAWVRDCRPPKVPRWLYDRAVEAVTQQLTRELRPTLKQPDRSEVTEALHHIGADDYDRWVQVGMALRATSDEYFEIWHAWSKASSKYVEGECERKWASFRTDGAGLTARSLFYWAEQEDGWRPPNRHEPLTDLGNARVLARMGEGIVKHDGNWGWMAWDGKRWALENAEKHVVELQKKALEYRLNQAITSLSRHLASDQDAADYDRKRKSKMKAVSLIRQHECETRIRGARTLAESEPTIAVSYRDFDQAPWFLNVSNGTLDLRSLELRPHDPTDRVTQLCPTPYLPEAGCPRWEKFLHEVFADDAELVTWVQRFLGYCLTGSTREHCLPIMHGDGRNGKSTLVKTVLAVLGHDYACTTPSGFLLQVRGEQHPTKLVTLYGKRFCADMETRDGGRLDEELVKRLTGGDDIVARRMHENFWSFRPTHKLAICTNYEPQVRGSDAAIWGRLRLVPFARKFEGADRDVSLDEKLASEAPGILRWMVDGCREWQVDGLGQAGAVSAATTTYQAAQDTVATFFHAQCTLLDGCRLRKSELTAAYRAWCIANRAEQRNPKAMGVSLQVLGVRSDETGKYYVNVKVS